MDLASKTFEKEGKVYKIRFFDANSFNDIRDLREIVQSEGVQEWMTNVRNFSHRHYQKWMNEHGEDNSFLFAIEGPDVSRPDLQRVHGFVYIYPSEIMLGFLEVSYAKRPGSPSGLTTPALKDACVLVKEALLQKYDKPFIPKVIAEIERGNDPSIKVAEKVGFVKTRDYDREGNGIWTLDLEKIGY
jgi:RimJ/RimL family protein N-acetyltransferase